MKSWPCQGSRIWPQHDVNDQDHFVSFTLQRNLHTNMRRTRLWGYSPQPAFSGKPAGFISTCFYSSKAFPIVVTVQTFNFCTSRPAVCQCLVVQKAMLRCQENNPNTSMTHIACESKLGSIIRSSIHPCQGN